jgi:cytochrome bd ubiquinol oxidase subunit II
VINAVWFVVLAVMLVGYAVLDGFDLGVGILHLVVPRDDSEREMAINAIGPVWNGNEVWLLAAGGSMVVAFPLLYAESFSGFYLALMIVLWLLVFRGLGIEFRHQIDHPLWRQAWDVAFSVASMLLAVLYGVAVGNVLRGVPLGANGRFEGTLALLLNPFAMLCGILSLAVLALHGASYLAMKTSPPLQDRSREAIRALWWVVLLLVVAVSAFSFVVRPDFMRNFEHWPVLMLVPLLALGGLIGVRVARSRRADIGMFLASAATIVGLLGSAAAGLFPRLLPSQYGSPVAGLDIYNAASPAASLRIALAVYLVGMAIVIVYLVNVYRIWGGRVTTEHTYRL